jgi:uncharacterized protein (TIGR00661 family)
MNILFGIQLTGNGHLTRSIELIKCLSDKGFFVDIITSGSNSQLELPFKVKKQFKGLSFLYNKTGGINWVKTILSINIIQFIKDLNYDVSSYDIIISDFEPVSAWSAKRYKIKSIGIGNQYSFISRNLPRANINIFSELFIKYFSKCEYNIGINYKEYDDFINLPIISESLINKKITDNGFYLVYLPSISSTYILNEIKTYGNDKWKVYSPDIKEDMIDGIIELKKLDKNNFTNDLLSCTGIITASGFSTTSEALVLGKKLWSIPIKGQYEQLCNAVALKKMGVFTDDLKEENIRKWIINYNNISYKWDNPIEKIINKIIEYAKD